jgi:transposase InsO family protein
MPKDWPHHVKSGLVAVIGLARVIIRDVCAGFAEGSADARVSAKVAELEAEVAALREELRIKDARMARVEPRKRPHFTGEERLAILALRAGRGWTTVETASRFHLTAATIAEWFARRDEGGDAALVKTRVPVNRLPDFVAEIVSRLRATFPLLGTKRIAEMLAPLGLVMSEATVRRLAKRPVSGGGAPPGAGAKQGATEAVVVSAGGQRVTARYAHHVWHTDLTFVPTWAGLWVPWFPWSLPQRWPFGYWVGAVLDHHTRAVIKARVWKTLPTAARVVPMLKDAVRVAGRAPKYIVCDRGCQFRDDFSVWCDAENIVVRYGAVHRHGSIAMIERFWRSMKDECFRRFPVPLALPAMRTELAAYVRWYNAHRPHQALGGLTPAERLGEPKPVRRRRPYETRARMPVARDGPLAQRPRRTKGRLELVIVQRLGGAALPVIDLREAA